MDRRTIKWVLAFWVLGLEPTVSASTLVAQRAKTGSLRRISGYKTAYRTSGGKFRAVTPSRVVSTEIQAETSSAPPKRRFFSDLSVQFAAGLNAGYGVAEPEKTGATRNALAFSVIFEKKLSDSFYLCPELSYVQRGVQTDLMTMGNQSIVGNVRLDYLELPLLLKMKFLSGPRWRIFLVGGPYAALALGRNVEVLGMVQLDLGSRFASTDVGAIIGGGVEYHAAPNLAFIATLRHHVGLVDIDTTDTKFRTRGFQLLLGAQFRL